MKAPLDMKLLILSDIHNEFSVLPYPEVDADVVILAGDIDTKLRGIDWAKGFNKPVLYVLGNHEFYGQQLEAVRRKTRERTQGTHVHLLDDEELILQGVRFFGGTLWTDFNLFGEARSELALLDAQFSMSDYRSIRTGASYRRLQPRDTRFLHEITVAFMKERLSQPFDGPTVVITHHAPSFQSIEPKYHHDRLTPAYASNLEGLMGEPVTLWIHGHVHHSNDYHIGGTRVVSNPRGYQPKGYSTPENAAFEPNFLVKI